MSFATFASEKYPLPHTFKNPLEDFFREYNLINFRFYEFSNGLAKYNLMEVFDEINSYTYKIFKLVEPTNNKRWYEGTLINFDSFSLKKLQRGINKYNEEELNLIKKELIDLINSRRF